MNTKQNIDGIVKPTDVSARNSALRTIHYSFSNIERDLIALKLSDDVMSAFDNFRLKLNDVTIASIGKPVVACGKLVSKGTILKAIIDSTGLAGWTSGLCKSRWSRTDIAETYDILVPHNGMTTWTFERNTNDRNQLFLIVVSVFPGHILIEDAATDRVSGFSCLFTNIKAMKSWLVEL
jgi:hypothetical protein